MTEKTARVLLGNRAACNPGKMSKLRRLLRGAFERAGCDPSSMRVAVWEPDCSVKGYTFWVTAREVPCESS